MKKFQAVDTKRSTGFKYEVRLMKTIDAKIPVENRGKFIGKLSETRVNDTLVWGFTLNPKLSKGGDLR